MKLSIALTDTARTQSTYRIMDLCEFLSVRVLEPIFARNGARWDRRFMNFFSFDNTCDPMEPTGTIRFQVPPMLAGQVGELEGAVLRELSQAHIIAGVLQYDRNEMGAVQGFRIPIIHNPTAQMAPPEVSMSYTRGCLVLRDLLGYQGVNGRFEIPTADLLQRLSGVTDERIAACTASPVREAGGGEIRRKPSAISMKSINRCVGEIRKFAQWAMSHQYQRIAAA